MADDLENRGPEDRSRISLTQEHEIRYWMMELGVSAHDLKRLVKQHGNSAEKIREELKRQRISGAA